MTFSSSVHLPRNSTELRGFLVFGRIVRRWLTGVNYRGGDNRQKTLFRRGRRSPLGHVQNTPFSASGQERNSALPDPGEETCPHREAAAAATTASSRSRASPRVRYCSASSCGATARSDKPRGIVHRRPQPRLRAEACPRGRAALAHAQHTGLGDILSERVQPRHGACGLGVRICWSNGSRSRTGSSSRPTSRAAIPPGCGGAASTATVGSCP